MYRPFLEISIGTKVNLLTVVSEAYKPEGKAYYVVDCVCDCGNKVTVQKRSLTGIKRQMSCGCYQRQVASKLKQEATSGSIFGRLVVDEDMGMSGKRHMVLCHCSCGTSGVLVRLDALKGGTTRSCGCLQPEATSVACTTHGMSKTRVYNAWVAMKQRCDNPNATEYEIYGGRGITYDPRWTSFENFLTDMGECQNNQEIDHIDNNSNYSKENCRWTSDSYNTHNQRVNRKGKTGSKYKGVTYDKARNKWASRLLKGHKSVFCARFATEDEAALAYDNASEKYYGDRPNKTVR